MQRTQHNSYYAACKMLILRKLMGNMKKTVGGLELFQHNQSAYEAVIRLMEEKGKAAVIHPTGTGKSFIAFKYAQEHPKQVILWLAPSEYIFRTQKESLEKAGGDVQEICKNIRFLTYSKLMIHKESIDELCPDIIILDEFHRCGALKWGRSVQKLLAAYPCAGILGLSATNIRYLDNQRDMAEELFEGCIASEMTLGEAIAMEILPAPVYVVSMYFYQEELQNLAKKIENSGNTPLRKENQELFEELKRILENAEGLDQIFYRHMGERRGKYIVFCSGREHMEEMVSKVSEWFHLVDSNPHAYVVYYDNPETSRDFSDFKADQSGHLCLLFCIDMLNEGVHVDDVDGVILLRPTVSPIIYLQQIGRSLKTGKNRQPVIFDIVNNFDNLCSIDSLQKEIEEAFSVIPYTGEKRGLFGERFRIYDELRDCRNIFQQINRNLCTSWDSYFMAAKEYYDVHGDLRIKKSYVTNTGLSVGLWLQTQRRVRLGRVVGNLSVEQIARLDSIGMEWEDGSQRKWNQGYQALKNYCNTYGNANVPARYRTEDGYALGKWVSNLRAKWKRGEYEGSDYADCKGKRLTMEQMKQLNKLGMIWEPRQDRWMKYYQAAEKYYKKHGNLNVPHEYVNEDGLSLGYWIDNQRRNGSGSSNRTDMLNQIGIIWESK